jgi:hypothetical protein
VKAVPLSSKRFTRICFVSFFRFGMLTAPAPFIRPFGAGNGRQGTRQCLGGFGITEITVTGRLHSGRNSYIFDALSRLLVVYRRHHAFKCRTSYQMVTMTDAGNLHSSRYIHLELTTAFDMRIAPASKAIQKGLELSEPSLPT